MDLTTITDYIRGHLKLLGGGLLLLILLVVASMYGFVTVEVGGMDGGEISVRLLEQTQQKPTEIKSSQPKLSKLVRRGSYEIVISQGDVSAFAVANTKGWFTRTNVAAELKPQSEVRFIGDGPEDCSYLDEQILYSYNCSGSLATIKKHLPANPNQPTYTQPTPTTITGTLEGVAQTNDGMVALMHSTVNERASVHTAHLLEAGVKADSQILAELDPSRQYTITSYREGFLAYDDLFEDIKYYPSIDSNAQTVGIDKSKTKLAPDALSVFDAAAMAVFSGGLEDDASELGSAGQRTGADMLMFADNQQTKLSYKGSFNSIRLCGSDRLCVLDGDQLSIFDISGQKLKQLAAVSEVTDFAPSQHGLLVMREQELLLFDPVAKSGYLLHGNSDYQYCGLQSTAEITVCIINNQNKRSMLRLNPGQPSDQIDTKMAALQKLPEIISTSIYGNYIFISVNVGIEFNPELGIFDFDPAAKQAATAKINQAINDLGIDLNKYQISIN